MTLNLAETRRSRWSGLYFDEWMQALADEVAQQVADHIPASFRDYQNCHPDLLPFYAYDAHAVAWTDVLGEQYARDSLDFAEELDRLAGTEEGWYVLCQSLGARGTIGYTSSGAGTAQSPVQKSVELFISPPLAIATNQALLTHLARVARIQTMPYTLSITAVTVINRTRTNLFAYMACSPVNTVITQFDEV